MSTAWITLVTNDAYAAGAQVLLNSLRLTKTVARIHCLVTKEVSTSVREHLEQIFDEITIVDVFNSNDEESLALIGRPDLGVTFTKLHCWRLTQYTKAVFLDADTMVLQNADELFERPDFSAAADIGWPDMFNSGVFVFSPSLETYRALVSLALTKGSFDGGDQGLLNEFYPNWRDMSSEHRLPFIYNMTSGAFYSYAAAYKRYGSDTKIVHFIGPKKPWNSSGTLQTDENYLKWHEIQKTPVEPKPQQAPAPAAVTITNSPQTSEEAREAWESGNPDVKGVHSFGEIQKALDESLKK